MYHISKSHCNRPSVWTRNRVFEWWDVIVPGFTNTQWLENFRMSKEKFTYLCNKLHPAMERQHAHFCLCVPLKKRVAIALWKLASVSEYRSVGHLFGACITVLVCSRVLCCSRDLVGTRTNSFSISGEVSRNACLY